MRLLFAVAVGVMAAASAAAEVKSSSPSHFELESRIVVPAAPAEAFAMLARPDEWWSDAHTYSGDSANMTLEPRAGGCFCETTQGGGSIEHMRIVYAQPGKVLRAQGGLGPLQPEAVSATLTWTLKSADGGTEITQTYIVSGHVRSGMEALAPLVDQVMTEQLSGLQKRLGR